MKIPTQQHYLGLALAGLWLAGIAHSASGQILQPIYSFPQGPSGPYTSLALGPDGNFYGTTYQGGSSGDGTVFEVTTNGVLTTLVNFANTNGANPLAGLTLGPDGNFYGTTDAGGNTNLNGGGRVRLDFQDDHQRRVDHAG